MKALPERASFEDSLDPNRTRFAALIEALPRVRAAFEMAAIEREHRVPIVKFKVHGKYAEPPKICKLLKKKLLRSGGEGGIRTHGTREGSTVFETARFNHSRTSPNVYSSLFPDSIQQGPRPSRRWNHYLPSPNRLELLGDFGGAK
jgi:hypothetical protein